ncbi:leucine repeat adapter protein 25-like [Asterias rubens]|uniref:leucine repeat adapter protein 25-like n=1 Tax=Asterias rubens TaxID=7604 RepID=UPI001454ED6C|nr:leucine repeat adapter protein 25-like [Asterias rubens]XP_033624672.1 leucine repeat adapter protein 25-like [Asterias rubens]
MAKAISPSAYSTAGVTMRVRKTPPRVPEKPIMTSRSSIGPMDAPGLPPLPKSLSSLLNANRGNWRETLRIQTHKNMIQDNLGGENKSATPQPSSGVSKGPGRGRTRRVSVPQGNLDGALAVLRKEMVGLRQLDMSLLSQLWSLHESIQEYKVVVETMSCLSDRDSMDLDSEDLQSLSPLSPGLLSPSSSLV